MILQIICFVAFTVLMVLIDIQHGLFDQGKNPRREQTLGANYISCRTLWMGNFSRGKLCSYFREKQFWCTVAEHLTICLRMCLKGTRPSQDWHLSGNRYIMTVSVFEWLCLYLCYYNAFQSLYFVFLFFSFPEHTEFCVFYVCNFL